MEMFGCCEPLLAVVVEVVVSAMSISSSDGMSYLPVFTQAAV